MKINVICTVSSGIPESQVLRLGIGGYLNMGRSTPHFYDFSETQNYTYLSS